MNSFIHLFIHSFINRFIHSFIHSFTKNPPWNWLPNLFLLNRAQSWQSFHYPGSAKFRRSLMADLISTQPSNNRPHSLGTVFFLSCNKLLSLYFIGELLEGRDVEGATIPAPFLPIHARGKWFDWKWKREEKIAPFRLSPLLNLSFAISLYFLFTPLSVLYSKYQHNGMYNIWGYLSFLILQCTSLLLKKIFSCRGKQKLSFWNFEELSN